MVRNKSDKTNVVIYCVHWVLLPTPQAVLTKLLNTTYKIRVWQGQKREEEKNCQKQI